VRIPFLLQTLQNIHQFLGQIIGRSVTTAIACAKQLIVGEEIQVWEGSRLVASLCPLGDIASAA
jgi:hypothetical protein